MAPHLPSRQRAQEQMLLRHIRELLDQSPNIARLAAIGLTSMREKIANNQPIALLENRSVTSFFIETIQQITPSDKQSDDFLAIERLIESVFDECKEEQCKELLRSEFLRFQKLRVEQFHKEPLGKFLPTWEATLNKDNKALFLSLLEGMRFGGASSVRYEAMHWLLTHYEVFFELDQKTPFLIDVAFRDFNLSLRSTNEIELILQLIILGLDSLSYSAWRPEREMLFESAKMYVENQTRESVLDVMNQVEAALKNYHTP